MNVGGQAIDAAVTAAFLAALAPAADARLPIAAPQLEARHDAALASAAARPSKPGTTRPGRAPLPGRRPGQPAGRPRPGNRVGARPPRTGRCRGRARQPRGRPPERPHPSQEKPAILALGNDLGAVMGRPDHHRQGPQAAAAHPARRSEHHAPPRRPWPARLPGTAVERRRDQRADRAATPPAAEDPHRARTPSP